MKWLGREDKNAPNLDYNGMPVFIVAVARGSVDTVINAIVLLTAGVLILVYGLFALAGYPLDPWRSMHWSTRTSTGGGWIWWLMAMPSCTLPASGTF